MNNKPIQTVSKHEHINKNRHSELYSLTLLSRPAVPFQAGKTSLTLPWSRSLSSICACEQSGCVAAPLPLKRSFDNVSRPGGRARDKRLPSAQPRGCDRLLRRPTGRWLAGWLVVSQQRL